MVGLKGKTALGVVCKGSRDNLGHFLNCIVLIILTISQFGCAPARLEKVIIEERLAKFNEYQIIQLIREGKRVDVKEAMELKPGDEIKTDFQSTVVITFLEGMRVVAEIIVRPDTHVKIVNPEKRLLLIIGEVFARIMEKGKFALQTEYVDVMPLGTEFHVGVDKSQEVTIVVIDGSLRLTSRIQVWEPITMSRFQQGSVSGEGKPNVRIADKEKINSIIRGVNDIERLMKGHESRLLVPDLKGLSENEALRALANTRLMAGNIKRVITMQSSVGTVVGQKPEAGKRVSPQSHIQIDVEAEPVRVPDLQGSSRGRAEEVLSRSGLSLGRIQDEITGRYIKDTILRQNPQGGEIVPKSSAIDIWIEAESVLVPDVRNLHIRDARQKLESANLRPGRVNEEMTGRVEPNTVLAQHPTPGTRLRPGFEVVLTMEVESAIVPSVERRHINEAIMLIQAAKLNFRKVREDVTGMVPHGTVLRQTPSAGTRVPLHTQVELAIEAESVIVPNVTGRHVNEAIRLVQSANLHPSTQIEFTGRATQNIVLRQNPGAGNRAKPGTAVTIFVEGAYFVMPNFIWMRIEHAKELLMKRGIAHVQIDHQETMGQKPGTVMDQYPKPGTPVRSLGDIRLVVAKEQQCLVPNVIGQKVRDAMRTVQQAGFVPQLNCRGGDPGGCDPVHGQKVLNQNPRGGTRPCGSIVVLDYYPLVK